MSSEINPRKKLLPSTLKKLAKVECDICKKKVQYSSLDRHIIICRKKNDMNINDTVNKTSSVNINNLNDTHEKVFEKTNEMPLNNSINEITSGDINLYTNENASIKNRMTKRSQSISILDGNDLKNVVNIDNENNFLKHENRPSLIENNANKRSQSTSVLCGKKSLRLIL